MCVETTAPTAPHDDTALLVMPLCHANSLYFGTTFIHLGATCVIGGDMARRDAEGYI